MTPQPFIGETVDAFVSAAKAAGKPLLVSAQAGMVRREMAPALARHDYPSLPNIDAAIRCLETFRSLAAPVPDFVAVEPMDVPDGLPASGPLGELGAKALLRAAGVATTSDAFAATKADAVSAAARLGYPVVLKAQSPTLVHKSDAGGVQVGLADGDAVGAAWDDIAASLARHGYHDMAGCVVAEMASGVAEMIVGARFDPAFGPLVIIGFGGVLVEIVEDIQVALAPISPAYALTMIKRLKLWPLLDGVRGRPAADVAAAAEAASRVSHLAAGLGERLAELDVNPLIVGAAGEGAVAVDGRATLNEGS
jgi:acetyl-CoA synthetase (ADP-forming)